MRWMDDLVRNESRRQFLGRGVNAIGWAAAASLLQADRPAPAGAAVPPDLDQLTHFAPKAKRVIYLHMVGGPSQLDLYDHKPEMAKWYDKDLPESIRNGQRLTTMTSGQKRFPVAPSKYKFAQHGQSGMWVSELLPYTARMVDDMCFIRSMNTEAINHEPAITLMQTGNMVTGRPCLGSWAAYGLGSANANLPTFVVLVAKPTNTEQWRGGGYQRARPVGLPPRRVRRRLVSERGRPDSLHQQPTGRFKRGSTSNARRPPRVERDDVPDDRRSRDSDTYRAV